MTSEDQTDRIQQLEKRIEELENKQQLSKFSRRGILGGIAGVAGLGAMSGSGTAASGQVGTANNRVNVFADDVGPRSVASHYLFAGEFSGGSPDSRLNSCLNAASSGDVIQLENAAYTQPLTVSGTLKLIGTNPGSRGVGTSIKNTTWTISDFCDIDSVGILGGGTLQLNNLRGAATNIQADSSQTVNIGAREVRLIGGHELDVTINADECVVLGLTVSTVTDNGTGNQVGLIS